VTEATVISGKRELKLGETDWADWDMNETCCMRRMAGFTGAA
jgi:hypothetical protein